MRVMSFVLCIHRAKGGRGGEVSAEAIVVIGISRRCT
jgi:hypothetical protein